MYTRRRALAIGAVGIGALSGCAEVASGDGPIERSAAPAEVESSTLDETGHELEEQREETISREVEAAGQSRDVEATNYATVYTKTIDGTEAEGSVFGLVTTPAFKIAGQSFSPVADADNEKILEFVGSQFGQLSVTETVEETERTILEEDATVTTFDAEAEFNGEQIPVYIHVTSVEHEDDIVIAAGAYPQELEDAEADNITTLLDGIDHPVDDASEWE
ncbi:MAG: DUF6517 family protein [Halohasta sp.]